MLFPGMASWGGFPVSNRKAWCLGELPETWTGEEVYQMPPLILA